MGRLKKQLGGQEGRKGALTRRQARESRPELLAHMALWPTAQAADTLQCYSKEPLSFGTLVRDLREQCALASSGNLARPEAILTAQAHVLDAIFHNLARRAALNAGEFMGACDTYLRLALKAQSQSRATLETLALMKHPQPLAFVKQANFGQAVQVNNGVPDRSRAREIENVPNKLLEDHHGGPMDTGATRAASTAHPQMETLDALNRPKDGIGEG